MEVLCPYMQERIEELLEAVRPALARHGGNVEFVDFSKDSGQLQVRLVGTCKGCPMADLTLKAGIEAFICDELPDVREVIAVE